MEIKKTTHANEWTEYTLINAHGMEVSILDFGGVITDIITPDQDGTMESVVLGYRDIAAYTDNPNFFGSTVGRVAGRIADAAFTIDGVTHELTENEAPNHLHGGAVGLHHVVWDARTKQTDDAVSLILSTQSEDGDEGYPGNVDVTVTYTLTNANELRLDYEAVADQTTALTLTNHTYFNLSGNAKKTIANHYVTMNSDAFVELDEALIPTGTILPVDATPFDFQAGRLLADGMNTDHPQNKLASAGYDHYFIFADEQRGQIDMLDDRSGRTLSVRTNQPGVVMYTANGLDAGRALTHGPSEKYLGVCFETQASPASLVYDGFPSVILPAHEPYHKYTVFSFGTKE